MGGCGCDNKGGNSSPSFKLLGGRRRSRRRSSKKVSSRRKIKKSKKNVRRRRRTFRRRRRRMRGGINADVLGDQATNTAHFTSKLLATPFVPPATWEQPANQSHGPGNEYVT